MNITLAAMRPGTSGIDSSEFKLSLASSILTESYLLLVSLDLKPNSGIDTLSDPEMNKLLNWLLYGYSGNDVEGSSPDGNYRDSFFVISKDSFSAYCYNQGFKELAKLSALVPNTNFFCATDEEEDNSEKVEVLKMTRFYEFVSDKKMIGLPVRAVTHDDDLYKNIGSEMELIERWPIVQAYALDIVGGGFFTMKHGAMNIRDELS
jgi:hypothetical protein